MAVKIREFRFPADHAAAVKLWEGMETGVSVGRSDSPEEIQKKIQRDPDLFLVAESNDEIVGTVIGGYDGRRGMIYHLAVHQSARKQGVGALLLNEVEERLRAKGCLKSYLLVKVDNESAMDFYKRRGWKDMNNDVRIFGKDLL